MKLISPIPASALDECPLKIMAVRHWIPEHRTEECDPEKKAILTERLEKLEALEVETVLFYKDVEEAIRESVRKGEHRER